MGGSYVGSKGSKVLVEKSWGVKDRGMFVVELDVREGEDQEFGLEISIVGKEVVGVLGIGLREQR